MLHFLFPLARFNYRPYPAKSGSLSYISRVGLSPLTYCQKKIRQDLAQIELVFLNEDKEKSSQCLLFHENAILVLELFHQWVVDVRCHRGEDSLLG